MLDAKSAYDVVQPWALEICLKRIGAPESFIKWAKATVEGHQRVVRTRSGMMATHSAFDLGGLPQGDPISPVMWAIVVDMAMSLAEEEGGEGYELDGEHAPVRAKSTAFADDLAECESSKEELSKTIQCIVTILSFLNVRLSPAKCRVELTFLVSDCRCQ